MNELQKEASNPNFSVWVSASAGTGKTKILTDRVLRLLLTGAKPEKILCLTFTNAAASEMQSRINSKLANWASLEDQELKQELQIIYDYIPSNTEIKYARNLYYTLLNTNEKINIHTIHSFCQKILKCFPIEARVSPGFQILDEIKAKEVISTIKNKLFISEDEEILDFLVTNFHETTINNILDEIIEHKLKFKKVINNVDKRYSFKLDSVRSLEEKFYSNQNFLTTFVKIFGSSSNEANAFLNKDKKALYSLFLTTTGQKKQKLLSKKIATQYPDLLPEMERIQEEFRQLDQLEKTSKVIKYSELLFKLAQDFINKYEIYKTEHSLLDYDDLIYYTRNLLTSSTSKDWVLYKLDGGIDHLLVDEAQDTSPEQWEIIEALISEFYSGEGAREINRTIFIVGDEKQSIFSFQGANLDSFNIMNSTFSNRLTKANKNYKIINLEWSYRSTSAVLDIVHDIFNHIKKNSPDLFIANNPKILPFRHLHAGKVELWPLIKAVRKKELFWPISENYEEILSPRTQLAIKIANFIKNQIENKIILPSTNKVVTPTDFMILVRKRDDFALEIIKQLKNLSLPISGIDRMLLNDNLSVMDLISAAKFVLDPEDDLNLACLLKSPLINLIEEELHELIILKKQSSLWKFISLNKDYSKENLSLKEISQKLELLIHIYKTSYAGDFFHILLDTLNFRGILVSSNGLDSNDAINELLFLCYNYVKNIDNSLQSFVYWFENNEIEVKRNVETSDKIRILTVHGAKGLEAPIVILCDTTSIPINQNKFIWTEEGNLIYSIPNSSSPDFLLILKENETKKSLQEYLRLLYVGMTRAEDHLIVCGYLETDQLPSHCWYELISHSMQKLAHTDSENILIYKAGESYQDISTTDNKILNTPPTPLTLNNTYYFTLSSQNAAFKFSPNSGFLNHPNDLQELVKNQAYVISPLLSRANLEYGKIFHKIIEDSLKSKDLSKLLIHPLIGLLPIYLQNKMREAINKLLLNKEFTNLTNQEIKTEINIGINQAKEKKIGRIDLLVFDAENLIIIDYKSDIKPAIDLKDVPPAYINQLNFYKGIMQSLYPRHKISCKILWLETGIFMNI